MEQIEQQTIEYSDEEIIKRNFSRNLSALRKSARLTQLQLAEKLNYSDKSVSKWERGDVLPDIVTISSIAKFFSVSIDSLISSNKKIKTKIKNVRLFITLLSCGLAAFIATFVFFVLDALEVNNAWLSFIYVLPVASVIWVVFSKIWFSITATAISVSCLVWSLVLAIFLSFIAYSERNLWFAFIVASVMQILVVLWFVLRKLSTKNK